MRILIEQPCCHKLFEAAPHLAITEMGTISFREPLAVEEYGLFTAEGTQLKHCPECGEAVEITTVRRAEASQMSELSDLEGHLVGYWGKAARSNLIIEAGISILRGDLERCDALLIEYRPRWRTTKAIRALCGIAWECEVPVFLLMPDDELRHLPPNAEVFDGE